MSPSWRYFAVVNIFFSFAAVKASPELRNNRYLDLPVTSSSEDYADSHEANVVDRNPDYYHFRPNFLPSSDGSFAFKNHPQIEDTPENKMAMELQKRISKFVISPQSRRWKEMFGGMPNGNMLLNPNREFIYNGQRIRPILRKDFIDGSFQISYPPGRKRPYYYSEPEGSEFLGGPGK
ncbi:uncharacterized protein LOC118183219 [Stegodyphus dumicola]|uniref:uncharacterized protein LOC118183219 n=1 Tax=Stegodyphus dumicola TaxID=202533 RepID=UPI0015B11A9A|nr:uncharacterized protein LOC118183219 [Stegodyphus dumicola]